VNTHTIGTDSYAIFDKSDKGSLLTLQFLWGKKDFRMFLERKGAASRAKGPRVMLQGKSSGEYVLTQLQYLYDFEWYDFDKVSGHGLAHDEVRWTRGGTVRYVELPQRFYDVAAELACREFSMVRKGATAKAV
jgi:hypothetical protein